MYVCVCVSIRVCIHTCVYPYVCLYCVCVCVCVSLSPGWVVGSLEILGSPASLVRSIGVGVADFFRLPYEGLTRGPGAFVTGVSRGTTSFVKHISKGTAPPIARATRTDACHPSTNQFMNQPVG